jgi:hypothetical protein
MGICSYAVLVVDHSMIRAAVVISCHIAFGALLAQASLALFLVAIMPLALWTGLMVVIRDWARTAPPSRRPPENSASVER